jgi:hypothetical protein
MTDAGRIGSPRALARVTGALYLYIMVAAIFAEGFVRDRLIVSGDGAETARRIAASEQLWRWGVVADVTTTLCDVAVAVLLFLLLKPAGPRVSLAAAVFQLVYSAMMAASAALLVGPLFLIKHAPVGAQMQMLVSYSLSLHQTTFSIGLILFGVPLVMIGLLIARSTFLPRLIGLALAVAGVCYITNSVLGLIAPDVARGLFPWILLPGFLAEGALTLWLIFVGVHAERWQAADSLMT